jgi:hypothetical protein
MGNFVFLRFMVALIFQGEDFSRSGPLLPREGASFRCLHDRVCGSARHIRGYLMGRRDRNWFLALEKGLHVNTTAYIPVQQVRSSN